MATLTEEQALEKFEKSRLKSRGNVKENFDRVIKIGNSYFVRCQGTNSTGSQCKMRSTSGYIYCKSHMSKKSALTKDVIKKRETLGIYNIEKMKLLKEELKDVNDVPLDELMDITNDIKLSQATISFLINSELPEVKVGEKYNGKKVNTEKERIEILNGIKTKRAAALQRGAINNASLKKIYFDVKYSDANTVTKEMFNYVFNQYNLIIQNRVKDVEILKLISEDVKKLGLAIKSGIKL